MKSNFVWSLFTIAIINIIILVRLLRNNGYLDIAEVADISVLNQASRVLMEFQRRIAKSVLAKKDNTFVDSINKVGEILNIKAV